MKNGPAATAEYKDASLEVERRVEDLLQRMTLEEKVAQLGCVWSTGLVEGEKFSPDRAAEQLRSGIGHVTRIGASTALLPRESAAYANAIQRYLVEETRLGIPAIVHEESTAGFCAREADQFPQAIGLASSWDPELLQSVAAVIREQMLAVGARQTLAPVLDIARDPRWGRLEETYGEDPYLTGRLGVAYVRGMQNDNLANGVAATAKHFLGYGVSEGGHNHKPAHIGSRDLREVFARPFLATIQEASLASIMNAYNEVDGLACGGSKEILDDLLRGELGFHGVVVADYFTTSLLVQSHRIASDNAEAGRIALEAGLDIELPSLDCYAHLQDKVDAGELAIEVIDRSVRRALRLKFALGLFENPYVDCDRAAAAYQTPGTRALARRAAQESLVLLKNDGDLLPLSPEASKIAVIGPCADDLRLLQGDYHYPTHLEIIYKGGLEGVNILPRSDEAAFTAGPYFPPSVTPLEGIRAAVGAKTEVVYAKGCDVVEDDDADMGEAVAAAAAADIALVFVGGRSGLVGDCTSGEFRDASNLALTGRQQELAEKVVATGKPTVVVLINGRVLALPWILEHVPAVVEAWLPGEEGGNGVADVLFGAVDASGRLPVTVPRDVGQIPLYYNRKWGDSGALFFSPDYTDLSASPLLPFGHGLSYTNFEYSDLELSSESVKVDGGVAVSFRVANTGQRDGIEVVQLYVRDPVASVTRPERQLAGFARVAVPHGEARAVRFQLDVSQLAFYDSQMRFVVEPGRVEFMVGASSQDIRLEGSFEVDGTVRVLTPADLKATSVVVEQPGE